tara:strand:- start:2191 stop:2460 length:270 start_codon:yes stop_codon:yes gene_type:complete
MQDKQINWKWTNNTHMEKSYPKDEPVIFESQSQSFLRNQESLRDTKRSKTEFNERMPILQKGVNPFIGNNYMQHIDTEQEFLRSKSSNM